MSSYLLAWVVGELHKKTTHTKSGVEVNVKELELLTQTQGILVKNIKANFKTLGPKFGKQMKAIAAAIAGFSQEDIAELESNGQFDIVIEGTSLRIGLEDAEITSQDIPGWLVLTENKITVALDITITDELYKEGLARELVNRIQNIRKDSGFEVTDRIMISIEKNDAMSGALDSYGEYIKNQVLASSLEITDLLTEGTELDFDDFALKVSVKKASN
jgi:isoleucyl-tRNA synthetase